MKNTDESSKEKKALMICYYLPPCSRVGALRSSKYVKYLGSYGWNSEVITAWNSRPYYEDNQTVSIHRTLRIDLERILVGFVKAVRFCLSFFKCFKKKTVSAGNENLKKCNPKSGDSQQTPRRCITTRIIEWLSFPDAQLLWMLFALPQAIWASRKCDIIYSSFGPASAHVMGLILKKLTRKPWVADYRDEWSLNMRWYPPTCIHRWFGSKLDTMCVRNADIVINVTDIRTQLFVDHFGDIQENYITLQNGYDAEDLKEFQDCPLASDKLHLTSLGSLCGGRDAKPFLSAMAGLIKTGEIDRNAVNVQLVGGLYPDLIDHVRQLEMTDVVEVIDRMPQKQAFSILAKSHVAVLVGSDMEKVAMTTKVYEYIGLQKRVFALAPDGPLSDFVKQFDGWSAPPSDIDKIQTQLRHIYDCYCKRQLSNRISDSSTESYERRHLTGQLARHFNTLLS